MVKRIIKVEDDVHQNLIKLRALYELRDGKRWTLSDLIENMVNNQPIWSITAEIVGEEGEKEPP